MSDTRKNSNYNKWEVLPFESLRREAQEHSFQMDGVSLYKMDGNKLDDLVCVRHTLPSKNIGWQKQKKLQVQVGDSTSEVSASRNAVLVPECLHQPYSWVRWFSEGENFYWGAQKKDWSSQGWIDHQIWVHCITFKGPILWIIGFRSVKSDLTAWRFLSVILTRFLIVFLALIWFIWWLF